MFIQEAPIKSRYGKPSGEWTEPRQVSIHAAFCWWIERRLLHEKTGDLSEYNDNMTELLSAARDIVFEMERAYWKAEFTSRRKAYKGLKAESGAK